MGLSEKLQKADVSRRSFLKGMAALGAAGAVAGCSKDDGGDIIYGGGGGNLEGSVAPEDLTDLSKFNVAYAACPHNCGPAVRCVSKIWTLNGRIVRVTTDDTEADIDGNPRDKNAWNDPRQISCAKGHSYKYRAYHSGRIKYPMKQTKARGDLSGFVRITWQQALNEVARKHRAIFAKYGPAAIHSGGPNVGYAGTWGNPSQAMAAITNLGGNYSNNRYTNATRGSFSDHSFHQYNYGYNMAGVPGSASYSRLGIGSQISAVAGGAIKNWVSFGTNSMSTNNTLSYPYLRANQIAKEKNPSFKHYVISPELTDTGVLNATDWVQIRNQTDPALIAAMIYEMLVNTFNADGSVKSDAWLDVNYIDTCLYGFFDSPEYWINTTTGEISLTEVAGYRKINAVPSGRSYASWIMGSDDRLTKANYSASNNYTARAYGSMPRAGLCSYPVKGVPANTAGDISGAAYYTKRDYMTPKTPEWAEKICGTPASVIRELAALYAMEENKPILTEWTGGLQKSENGVITLFAIQTLFAVTKNWGYSVGSTGGMYQTWASNPGSLGTAPNIDKLIGTAPSSSVVVYGASGSSQAPTTPSMSCKEHFNGLYFAFKEVLDSAGFKGYSDPHWDGETRYLNDDAGAKSQVLFKRSGTAAGYVTFVDSDGRTYNDYVGREEGKPVYVGKRMYIGGAGVLLNGIANPNWAAEIFRTLPLAGDNPDDPDTFCMAIFDAYMSPQARFADYVFPMVNTLEACDSTSVGGITFHRLPLATPPGEVKDGWEAAFLAYQEQYKLGEFSAARIDGADDYKKSVPDNAGYVFTNSTYPNYRSVTDLYKAEMMKTINTPGSRYEGMTVDQAIGAQIVPKTAVAAPEVTSYTLSAARQALDEYLAGPMDAPFITFTANHQFSPSVGNAMATFTAESENGMPGAHGRMTCYAEYAVYTWEHAYDIFHAWLPASERGQKNVDYENDPKLYPIPMYYAFEDAFNERYGVFNPNPDRRNLQEGWKLIGPKPATNDVSLITDRLTLTVGSTHDRYRSHSSQAENPYLRELNHRKKGGSWMSGNDWNEYCVVPEVHSLDGKTDFNQMISGAIEKKNMETASWHEFWMNKEDAAQFGIADGDLIRVSNPVGAIRVIARVTDRIVRGHGQIHHGSWYDPNPVDGVDDGACANTLMSNLGSKFDNGNAVHCAYCVVEKETSF